MTQWTTAVAVTALLLLTACPGPPGPERPGPARPKPQAAGPEDPQSEPPDTETGDAANPSEEPDGADAPLNHEAGEADAPPNDEPDEADAPPAEARCDRIAPGTVLRPCAGVSVGLVEVTRQPAPEARISVGYGAYAFSARLGKGGRLHVAGGEAEVAELTPGGAVELRWLKQATDEVAARPSPAPRGEVLALPAMGLYALGDGRVLAVGNVREVTPLGEEARIAVTLALYPKGYERDPTIGYDLFLDAAPGAALPGKVGRLRLERAEPSVPTQRGRVALRIR